MLSNLLILLLLLLLALLLAPEFLVKISTASLGVLGVSLLTAEDVLRLDSNSGEGYDRPPLSQASFGVVSSLLNLLIALQPGGDGLQEELRLVGADQVLLADVGTDEC